MTQPKQLKHETVLEAEVIDAEYEIDDQIDILEAEAGEKGINYTVRVYRSPEGKGGRKFLFICTTSNFSMEYIRDHYGSGNYDIWVFKDNHIHKRWTKEIEAPANWKAPPAVEEKKLDPPDPSHVIVAGLTTLGEMIVKMNENMNERISSAQAAQVPAVAPIDPITMQTAMLNSLLQMKQLIGPPEGGNNHAKDLITVFQSGLELAKDIGGGGEKSIWDVLEKMPAMLGQISEYAKANPPPAILPAPIAGDNLPTAMAPPSAQSQGEPVLKELFFKKQLDMLVAKAEKGSDPGLYADFILDNMPEDAIRTFLGDGDPFPHLVELNPNVAQHETWFRSLGVFLNESLAVQEPTGDNADDDDDTGEPLPDDDAPKDAATTSADKGGDATSDT